jgi:hypothetical protein
VLWLAAPARAEAQLGAMISPGKLARAHQALEGISNCQKCHEQGRKTTAEKCFGCHAAVAERIARKRGVHRNVTRNCATCHAEHGGTDGVLRPFDPAAFDHASIAGFPLTGRHAAVADRCAACHKTRSFLTVAGTCTSCHTDVHNGTLGTTCTKCHSTQVAFRDAVASYDHSKAAFRLAGAHRSVPCASCHVNRAFKGIRFASCTSCHRDPHRQTFGAVCTTCHTSDAWRTRKVDHSRTGFVLVGRHSTVDCASCHRQSAMKAILNARTCAACHADVHRGTFKQDCGACHSESGFASTPFDHSQTRFILTGKHANLECRACHTGVVNGPAERRSVDFRGLKTACVSCHADVHRATLGTGCDSCHTPSTFRVTAYTHTGAAEFFTGSHASLECAGCHARAAPSPTLRNLVPVLDVTFAKVSRTCAGCHDDVHLGQLGLECESCHSVRAPKFALTQSFSHARTNFPLTGGHASVECARCHKRETGAFPAGSGTAVRLKAVARECSACHADVHLGQLETACDTCHTTASFRLAAYAHRMRSLSGFFVGRHRGPACQACHKPVTGRFPNGTGTAVQFKVGAACVTCHVDVHRGALGSRCSDCHRP